ncbi:hypothetical protein Rleg4DRAFT_6603 [Rhizobium leguminosarum bv. trifolii WSM2297]|uniref:DUF72 domain-containing protein n=1 Tax=Rhizobium leguminosarum bv. trifolii WSM2297 TaxID=754762 RepID=J0CXT1_RHILT|nr:DUF72 domain-containing protein [Rhizobium leguminosarum]EJC83649.1 hypothetical protein Rleg4DRAFT_5418 [Rhizobium leguminosarum bv. trifolii WSM2297]EJC84760.1 hypothetical protein Rleg4DRAFT_6603 [Rhizobium leguminosarum bv. trifolii WSM2297]
MFIGGLKPACEIGDRDVPEVSIDDREKRKARRAERRQKQREANVERAAKMHEARVDAGERRVAISDGHAEGRVHIGCSGWYYWHWQGSFYPADLPRKQWFSFYEREFETVELNAPFYSWPTVATVKTWLRQVTGDFVYTIKVCELITHIRRFEETDDLIRDFGYIADMLDKRMGCFLFQLPPSIRYSPDTLQLILRQLDPQRRNVVEFRHKTWWNDEVFKQFEAAGAIFCSCSGPRLPDELVKTADDIYIRFHGTTRWYRHDYSEAELTVWAERIKSSGAKTVWTYFNNDRDAHAINNAKMLSRLLGER